MVVLEEKWNNIEPEILINLVDSMPRRVHAVLDSHVTTPSSHQYSRKGWTSDETKSLELRPHKRRVNTGNFSGSFELQHTDKKLRPMVKSDTGYDAPGPSTH
ncbi:unnamed protein product [Rhizophagus irregularis]|nr:unnamed protein product [Rhizophagus irregularis]